MPLSLQQFEILLPLALTIGYPAAPMEQEAVNMTASLL
jgi:hypothetical protein